MSVGHRPALLRAATLTLAVLVLAFGLVVAPSVALLLAPAAVLLVLLAHGVFLGEELLTRLRTRQSGPRRRLSLLTARPRRVLLVRRTGRHIAFALAVRPPPVAALAR